MARRPVQECFRGHKITGANRKEKNRGKGCRSCECAHSMAHNELHRKGIQWYEGDVQAYADLKYEEFRHEGL